MLLMLFLFAQNFDSNYRQTLIEINSGRYDKALRQLLPMQVMLREKTAGKFPAMDLDIVNQMETPGAVLGKFALFQVQLQDEQFEEANATGMLVGLGLSRLWARTPAYQKLDFARQDLAAATPLSRDEGLKGVGYAAVDAGEWELARKTAMELLASSDKKELQKLPSGAIRHSALTIQGLAQLGMNDVSGAEKSLIASMKVRGETSMQNAGPNFRLAIELIDKGRIQAVDQFLVLVGNSVWRGASKAAEWRKDLAAGKEIALPKYSGVN